MFENKWTKEHQVHYSRYIASWIKAGGRDFGKNFVKWLKHLELDEDEIREIRNFATNGKLELESDAKAFLNDLEEEG